MLMDQRGVDTGTGPCRPPGMPAEVPAAIQTYLDGFRAAAEIMRGLITSVGVARTGSPSGYDERLLTGLLGQALARQHHAGSGWWIIPEMPTRAAGTLAKLDLAVVSPEAVFLVEAKRFYTQDVRGGKAQQLDALRSDLNRWRDPTRFEDLTAGRIDIGTRTVYTCCLVDCWSGYRRSSSGCVAVPADDPAYRSDLDAISAEVCNTAAFTWSAIVDLTHTARNGTSPWGYWWLTGIGPLHLNGQV